VIEEPVSKVVPGTKPGACNGIRRDGIRPTKIFHNSRRSTRSGNPSAGTTRGSSLRNNAGEPLVPTDSFEAKQSKDAEDFSRIMVAVEEVLPIHHMRTRLPACNTLHREKGYVVVLDPASPSQSPSNPKLHRHARSLAHIHKSYIPTCPLPRLPLSNRVLKKADVSKTSLIKTCNKSRRTS
jgi:hypothetical protein